MTPTVDDIERILKVHAAAVLPDSSSTRAAVAMVLRDGGGGPEVLFIERAAYPADPWSGNLGFPGGKVEQGDDSPRSAAERETHEELGIDLKGARYLGFLGEIAGAHLPVRVSCFVYLLAAAGVPSLNGEIVDAFWVPLSDLVNLQRHCLVPIPFRGETLPRPCIRLPQADKPYLWGITYRLVMELLRLLQGAAPSFSLNTTAV